MTVAPRSRSGRPPSPGQQRGQVGTRPARPPRRSSSRPPASRLGQLGGADPAPPRRPPESTVTRKSRPPRRPGRPGCCWTRDQAAASSFSTVSGSSRSVAAREVLLQVGDDSVPGIGSITDERCSSQASATCGRGRPEPLGDLGHRPARLGQPPGRDREPRDEADALLGAVAQHVVAGPVEQVVAVLHGRDVDDRPGRARSRSTPTSDSPTAADLALGLQRGEQRRTARRRAPSGRCGAAGRGRSARRRAGAATARTAGAGTRAVRTGATRRARCAAARPWSRSSARRRGAAPRAAAPRRPRGRRSRRCRTARRPARRRGAARRPRASGSAGGPQTPGPVQLHGAVAEPVHRARRRARSGRRRPEGVLDGVHARHPGTRAARRAADRDRRLARTGRAELRDCRAPSRTSVPSRGQDRVAGAGGVRAGRTTATPSRWRASPTSSRSPRDTRSSGRAAATSRWPG